ncbi:MAG: tyrosine-type recombinase/integrase [Dehalococcoidia bacterium]|jgi:integrase
MATEWETAKECYLLHMAGKGCVKETIAVRRVGLERWSAFCEDRAENPLAPPPAVVDAWLSSLYRRYARNTVCGQLDGLRAFFRWRREFALLEAIPTSKRPNVPIRPYSADDVRALLAAADSARDKAMILLLFGSGLRCAEVIGIRMEDVDWPAGSIRVLGKGSKVRLVCPGAAVMAVLRAYVGDGQHEYLFPGRSGHLARCSLWLLIERLAVKAGIDGGVHRFRHAFASNFLALGGDVGDLQKILGHASITMSLHYASYTATERALAAQKRFNPVDSLLKGDNNEHMDAQFLGVIQPAGDGHHVRYRRHGPADAGGDTRRSRRPGDTLPTRRRVLRTRP